MKNLKIIETMSKKASVFLVVPRDCWKCKKGKNKFDSI